MVRQALGSRSRIIARFSLSLRKKVLSILIKRTDPAFFGWRMVAVAFFVDFIAVGFFFYSYGVFFKAIAAEFGDSRLGVSIGTTVTMGVGAILAPFIGQALDRYPLRSVIAIGAISTGTGFLLLGFVETPRQVLHGLGNIHRLRFRSDGSTGLVQAGQQLVCHETRHGAGYRRDRHLRIGSRHACHLCANHRGV